MAKFNVGIETAAEPQQVVDALIDFSDGRPEIWPGLAREFYEVYSVGETSAEIREGSSKPVKVWARERYEWSTPGVVRWEVLESNFCRPGSYVEVRVEPKQGGGSHVDLEWNRTPSNAKGRVAVMIMKVAGPSILKSYMTKTLRRVADSAAS
ncbi:MAG: SRPBCC family protein [Actinomycetota bacterium]|nr:SRPBCC family protein [Actinomycetota bacterium]